MIMEKECKKKRRSREKDAHHIKKKRDPTSHKNSKRHEFRQRHHLGLGSKIKAKMDDDIKSKDKNNINVVDEESHRHPFITSSSSPSSSSSSSFPSKIEHVDGVFDFPWLKLDEDAMFKADDIDQNTTSLEEFIQQQMMAPAGNNSYQLYDQNVRLGYDDFHADDDRKIKCCNEELDMIEYCIWSTVLDQPLDTGIFNKF